MSDEAPEPAAVQLGEMPVSGEKMWVSVGVTVGVLSGIAGVIDGLVMVLQRHEVGCADGTYFPQGATDFRCFSHPHVANGIAVMGFSVMLSIVILLTGFIANQMLRARSAE